MQDIDESGISLSEGFFADWEPIPYRFYNLQDLFLAVYSPPESNKMLEKSCDLITNE